MSHILSSLSLVTYQFWFVPSVAVTAGGMASPGSSSTRNEMIMPAPIGVFEAPFDGAMEACLGDPIDSLNFCSGSDKWPNKIVFVVRHTF
jgi:hypothetical protein